MALTLKAARPKSRKPEPPDPKYVYRRELVTSWELRERIEIGDEPILKPLQLRGPEDLLPYLRPWAGLLDEHLIVVMLDSRMRVMGHAVVSIGTAFSTPASGRAVARAAVMSGAAAIIVAHNHPSGVVEPSPDDIEATKRLYAACVAVETPLLDHIVVGIDPQGGVYRHTSLKERGVFA